ncbi:hypothetical protein [Chryseobacterium gambrini]|jgi:hypothetical protein|uniref:hypothetical protein n=1 Tax=Chryseobacterium gambrini TaxID=373672 RepID=UPI0025B42BEB|nr:hypothetical protein [Chryseobacterium gambrini]MDN4028929.1 hypothetical protein [Chryseobacterium gambrini]
MDTVNNTYPALKFPASELSAFAAAIHFFIISLKNGDAIHFTPDNVENFYRWLMVHNIRDIKAEKTKTELSPVINSGGGWKELLKRKSK